MKCCYPRSLLK